MVSTETATWSEAQLRCKSKNGSLASMTRAGSISKILKPAVSTTVWLGGYRPPGGITAMDSWTWDDGSTWKYETKKWDPYPTLDGGDGLLTWNIWMPDCLIWYNQAFHDTLCTKHFQYICKKKSEGN